MANPKLHRLSWYAVAGALVLAATLLAWEVTHGGVPSHHFLDRADLPTVSNWWMLVVLPVLGWLASRSVLRRAPSDSDTLAKASAAVIGAALVGVALSVAFDHARAGASPRVRHLRRDPLRAGAADLSRGVCVRFRARHGLHLRRRAADPGRALRGGDLGDFPSVDLADVCLGRPTRARLTTHLHRRRSDGVSSARAFARDEQWTPSVISPSCCPSSWDWRLRRSCRASAT